MIKQYKDHAANERNCLAWLRTGIAIIAFGFVLAYMTHLLFASQ